MIIISQTDQGNESKAMVVWKDSPTAARIAYELFREVIELSDLEDLLDWVDKLDSGSVSHEEFLLTPLLSG